MGARRVKADVAAVLGAVEDAPQETGGDPLLTALADAQSRRLRADEEIRLLLAYARRFVYPHPYTFGELAAAAGMSVSGVRTAYGAHDVDRVAAATGLNPIVAEREEV